MTSPLLALLAGSLTFGSVSGCAVSAPKQSAGGETAESAGGGTGVLDEDGDGYGADSDCDDADPAVYPGATEVCNGVDDDCDGEIDDDAMGALTWYTDADGDGYGDAAEVVESCDAPAGTVSWSGDCDDGNADVYPGAAERCDGIDDDCDGVVDDHPVDGMICYADEDGDGYGDLTNPSSCCALGDGWVSGDLVDCDDASRAVYPGALEVCNGVDDDCDGQVDEDNDADDAVDHLCDLWGDHSVIDSDLAFVGGVDDAIGWTNSFVMSDVDADGYDDLWAGGVTSAVGGYWSGVVYLLKGPLLTGGYATDLAAATIVGASDHYMAGSRVEDAGDVDGDGYPDVWISAAEDASTTGTGSVHLVLGPVSGTMSLADSDLTWYPNDPNDPLYYNRLGVGDYDGDGIPDLVIGAELADADRDFAGKAWITRLDDTWGERSLSDAPIALLAENEKDCLGLSATMMGSTTGDGTDDILVSAFLEDSAALTGAAWVIEEPPADGTYLVNDIADAELMGESAEDGAGMDVVGLGDMNGDGYTDYAVGAGEEDSGGLNAGAIYVIYGPTGDRTSLGEADAKLLGAEEGTQVYVVEGKGDVDGDGNLDLVAGGFQWGSTEDAWTDGVAYLVRGPLESGTTSLSAADASFDGAWSLAYTGAGLSISGDANNDGYDDLIIGTPGYQEPDGHSGLLSLFFGQPF